MRVRLDRQGRGIFLPGLAEQPICIGSGLGPRLFMQDVALHNVGPCDQVYQFGVANFPLVGLKGEYLFILPSDEQLPGLLNKARNWFFSFD